MACSHVGHDCQVGNDVIFANGVLLGGHSVMGDHVFMSAAFRPRTSSPHRHRRDHQRPVGLRSDVIPVRHGASAMRRAQRHQCRGHAPAQIHQRVDPRGARDLSSCCSPARGKLDDRLAEIEAAFGQDPAVAEIVAFVRSPRSKRPLCSPDRSARGVSAMAHAGGPRAAHPARDRRPAGDRLRRRNPALHGRGSGAAAGRRPVLFAVRGFADAEAVAAFDHHWIGVGQLGRFLRMARPKAARRSCSSAAWCGRRWPSSGRTGRHWRCCRVSFRHFVAAMIIYCGAWPRSWSVRGCASSAPMRSRRKS